MYMWRFFKMFLNRIYYGIAYIIVLILEIIKATFDTATRAVKGSKTIEPVVIDIKTDLTRPISQTLLANSITLTPGTLTIDLDSEKQLLKVAIIAPRDQKDVIPFEPYIKRMLE
ncbi:MAG: Na+/H+ antiporter subunit E [Methanobrevibacter sp.]|nr:Na+/H+ antiporter subunit E [Methanobrevibacter sp.]MEA4956400.1 Na+/H+ antiporter subunit E [Methanobrevibacter sp.]